VGGVEPRYHVAAGRTCPFVGHTGIVCIQRQGSEEVSRWYRDTWAPRVVNLHGVHGVSSLSSHNREGLDMDIVFVEGDVGVAAQLVRTSVGHHADARIVLDAPFDLIQPLHYPFAAAIRASTFPRRGMTMPALLPTPTASRQPLRAVDHSQRKGDGPMLVVLHHSFGSPGWLPFYDDLPRDFTVIVPHLPGFGPLIDRTGPAIPVTSRCCSALAAQADHDAVTLVGCGFGGWLAVELATMAPDASANSCSSAPPVSCRRTDASSIRCSSRTVTT
jgi:hypothetical protein